MAAAARKMGLCSEIIGIDKSPENLRAAHENGVIDRGYDSIAQIEGALDLLVLSTPVGTMETLFAQLKPTWSESTIYTDTGSTKENVILAAQSVFGQVPKNFVPGHPIAGSERSGVLAANADLYRNKRVILTPLEETDPAALDKVERLWQQIGARVSLMEPQHHDDILAETSHLPHVIAFSLVDLLGRKDEQDEILQYAAGGFKDFTRLASSDPRMWLDICLANRKRITVLLEEFREELALIKQILDDNDADTLFDLFCSAKQARQRFLEQYELD